MIASVSGRVTALTADGAVIEVGGVGLCLVCTPATRARLRIGEPARLATSLVVREDALTLFGFLDDDERAVFELLQSATGVGPRLAQAVLGVHAPAAVRVAVATEDVAALTMVPGIGRKGAQRIVLELKDRLGAGPAAPAGGLPGAPGPIWREQLRGALTGLGWTSREVDEALIAVGPEADAAEAIGEAPQVADLLRSALRMLSRA
ncbi:MAG TPA: Holliday junction branch migration protein RuvA [Mycobacteriales bacterium]|nr:Holliday junction branch migration protein RuvA [Mycobacteriales bacterium]